jgi:hypothetical protein
VVAAAVLGACGGSGEPKDVGARVGDYAHGGVPGPRYPYPAARVRAFVSACAATPDQLETCRCTIEWLQSTLAFADFDRADHAIRAGQPVPRQTRALIDDATDACRS